MSVVERSRLYEVILENQKVSEDADRILKEAIIKELEAKGFGDVEETSVAFVRGNEVVFSCYVCQDLECADVKCPLQPDDITLGGDIGTDSVVLHV